MFRILLIILMLATPALAGDAAAQRVLRPDPRAVEGGQRGVHSRLAAAERPDARDQAVARRLRLAGARGGRRPRGRRRDPGVVAGHRRDPQGRPDQRRLGEPLPQQLGALQQHHRLPGPQGESEGDQGLAGHRQAGRRDHHPEPQDLGQRQAQLPRRLGRGAAERRQRGATRRNSSPSSTSRLQCSTPGRAAPASPSRRRASATCSSPGRTKPTCNSRRRRASSRSSTHRSASWPSRRSPSSTSTRAATAPPRRPTPISTSSTRPAGQELIAQNYYRPIDAAVAAKYQSQFPAMKFFKIDAVAKDWNDAYAKYFGEGKVFDSIYQPGK